MVSWLWGQSGNPVWKFSLYQNLQQNCSEFTGRSLELSQLHYQPDTYSPTMRTSHRGQCECCQAAGKCTFGFECSNLGSDIGHQFCMWLDVNAICVENDSNSLPFCNSALLELLVLFISYSLSTTNLASCMNLAGLCRGLDCANGISPRPANPGEQLQ